MDLWVIDEDNLTSFNHALILLEWADIHEASITYKEKQRGDIMKWNINKLKQDSEALEKTKKEYLF